MQEKVEAALEKIRPMLAGDGGGVDLVSIEDGVVKVKLTGACGHYFVKSYYKFSFSNPDSSCYRFE